MGYSKKLFEEMTRECVGIVLPDEYGEPKVYPRSWEHLGWFDGMNVYRKIKE